MTSLVAVIRPADWEAPLFVHVVGATVLVGGLLTVVSALAVAARGDAPVQPLTRLAFRSALFVTLPAFVVMRAGAQWSYSREYGSAAVPDWVAVGLAAADFGAPLLVATVLLAGIAARRRDAPGALPTAGAIVGAVLLLAYLVAVWAMTTKPGS